MSELCNTEEINNLYSSSLMNISVTDMKQYLIQKYAELTGNYTFELDVPFSKLKLKTTWERGALEGPASLLWEDGSIAVEFGYRDFVPHGRAVFYEKQNKVASMTVMDGKYIGECEIYYNGLLMYSGDFFHGDANGKGILYYPNGNYMYEGEFRNGYADGKGIYYDPSGKDLCSDSWKRGKCKLTKTVVCVAPMIVVVDQTHDEIYTEEECARRISSSLPFLKTFNLGKNSTTAISKKGDGTTSDSSDMGIPIPRGQLTKHILEQQVVARSSDEDFMNLPLAKGSAKNIPKKALNKAKLSEAEELQKQPTAIYVQPSECPKPPEVTVKEKVVSIYSSDEWKTLSKQVTDLTIETECFNDEYIRYMKFNTLKLLQHLTINDYSCTTVNTFTLRNNQYIRSLQIGNDCFSTGNIRNASEYNYMLKAIQKDIEGGSFFVSLDYYLESIVIGKQSFLKFSRFALSLLPNLRVLIIGEVSSYDDINTGSFNFLGVSTLYIEKLPKLKKLVIGSYSFTEVRNVFIQDLPALKHIELGHSVFRGDETYKMNSINFKALPALDELIMRDSVGKNIQYLNINDSFSDKTLVEFQIGAVFNDRIKMTHEGCPEQVIEKFLNLII